MSDETFHRISDPEYAKNPRQMLSGEGSYLHGGRWNTPGHHVIYLSQSLSLAAYEQLVHVPLSVLQPFKRIEIYVPEELIMVLDDSALGDGWNEPFSKDAEAIGDQWIESGKSLALSVPSALIPGERNILISPEHPDFHAVTTSDVMDFNYDARLADIPKK
ncbi:RES domain-containing protein [Marinobacter sp. LV10R510-11A]|uniref:RES family NAD+ phosphorylase n=1 Tax=Marinobacter sp. LV10R510-11A TaxID=1415568 RepID=UPI000BB90D28|nr:RES family NAD+ phosphorylase [Marinobacter sp. LV10R510-11A]SOB74768.1 RES domain-containing protein [Marinobacter sp. LV10R510-11A]